MKSLIIGLFLIVSTVAYAQDEQNLELLRTDIKTQKVALMTGAMTLTDAQGAIFWPIYREYDHELAKIGDRTIALIKEYAASYQKMDDKKAEELTGKMFKNRGDRLDLVKKYHKNITKALGGAIGARYAQAELEILTVIDMQVMKELPLIHAVK